MALRVRSMSSATNSHQTDPERGPGVGRAPQGAQMKPAICKACINSIIIFPKKTLSWVG